MAGCHVYQLRSPCRLGSHNAPL